MKAVRTSEGDVSVPYTDLGDTTNKLVNSDKKITIK